ncbi:hemerythrin domain-containing protein [uncultured Abyssibacter sp.]|uniref:hemerythrin domain-containing protein n=1 Tax=uncultured Abyssibacter sp. TaxID=2320202 RepID=UPI0032B2E942
MATSLHALIGDLPHRDDLDRDAGWEGIVSILIAEHRCLHILLDTLADETAKLQPGRIPDYHLLADIVDYLIYYPDRYHHTRENLLFDHLRREHPRFKRQLNRLVSDHQALSGVSKDLYVELRHIRDGRRANRPELAALLERFIDGYRKHLHFETSDVFPLATGEIGVEDWNQLKSRTRFVDDPLFGDDIQLKYFRLQRAIQEGLNELVDHLPSSQRSALLRVADLTRSILRRPQRWLHDLGEWKRSLLA